MAHKQTQLITLHSYDFSDNIHAIKVDITKYPRLLEYRIPLQADDDLDSLDNHLKIEGESRPYEVRQVENKFVPVVKELSLKTHFVFLSLY